MLNALLALQNFGSFIPGHGGVTDRCDCMFLCAAIIHFYYNAFGEERVGTWCCFRRFLKMNVVAICLSVKEDQINASGYCAAPTCS